MTRNATLLLLVLATGCEPRFTTCGVGGIVGPLMNKPLYEGPFVHRIASIEVLDGDYVAPPVRDTETAAELRFEERSWVADVGPGRIELVILSHGELVCGRRSLRNPRVSHGPRFPVGCVCMGARRCRRGGRPAERRLRRHARGHRTCLLRLRVVGGGPPRPGLGSTRLPARRRLRGPPVRVRGRHLRVDRARPPPLPPSRRAVIRGRAGTHADLT
jgi:hypothetical protein